MLRATRAAPLEDVEVRRSEGTAREAQERFNAFARAALLGDRSALRELLRAAEPLVRRVCRGVMGRECPDLEDAIQDGLIDVARALPSFRFECTVTHYITKIAMRRAIASRRRLRARWKQQATLDSRIAHLASVDRLPDGRADLVRHLLDDLNEAQATALLLRIMMGNSMEEIASITRVSVNTVKTRLRLGKKQLRRWLEQKGEGGRAGG